MNTFCSRPEPLMPGVLDHRMGMIVNTPRGGIDRLEWRVHSATDAFRLGLLLANDTRMAAACAGWAWHVVIDPAVPADHFLACLPVAPDGSPL